MTRILKSPLWLIKLIDAFIMRIPLAILIVSGVYVNLSGNIGIENGGEFVYTIGEKVYVFFTALVFAFVHGLLFVSIYPRRTSAQKSTARFCEVILVIGILAAVSSSYSNYMINTGNIGIGLAEYIRITFFSNFATASVSMAIVAWVVYMIISERIKGKAEKKARKRVPASENPTYKTFCELSCVYSTFLNYAGECDRIEFDKHMKRVDELLAKTKPSTPPAEKSKKNNQQSTSKPKKNKKICSGNSVGIAFFDSEAMKDYKKYILSNHVVICISGKSAFVVKLIEKQGDYRQAHDCWYRNDKRTSNYTAEVEGAVRSLKTKCDVTSVRGVIAKAFSGGSIISDNSYEIIDVSKSYDLLEKEIKIFMPADSADQQQTAATAKKVVTEFSNRFAVEKKEA